MGREIDLPKLSSDIQRALAMPSGPEKEKLSNEVLSSLSELLVAMSKIAEKIGTDVEPTSYDPRTQVTGRSKAN